ncbi:TrmH family RNA methyltransferase [Galactobacter caseinivorans]|uniref:RNA methyltransferase n=1 Tax=Galactobacter caseinivorans TaxID=2676123 RepID=A0A496PKS7_9MICC|nr:RNA methyltransferase [Galactobacter caseinivorans]RKW71088.1 RNA methyltransferase [Galactobacter caseinivorans]
MSIVEIGSTQDPRLADYAALTDAALRGTRSRFIAESTVVVRRALEAGCVPVSFLLEGKHHELIAELAASHPQAPVFVGDSAALQELTGFHLHRGALASFERPQPLPVASLLHKLDRGVGQRSRVVVLEDLAEHTNVGAAFRSAAAFGADAVLVSPQCSDPLYRRSIRVSMGTVFQVPWTRVEPWPAGISELQAAGYVVAGMTLGEGAISLDELVAQDHQRLALVFGNEGHGLRHETEALVDRRVTIPMMGGVDSLNVAASAAVALYSTR